MNGSDCPEIERLSEWSRLPNGHAQRMHLDSCARCQARLIALAEFVAPSKSEPPESEWRAAEAELRRRRVQDRLVPSQPGHAPAGRVSPRARLWRPALAFAGVAVVAAGAWFTFSPTRLPNTRGIDGAAWQPRIEKRGAALELSWRPVTGAERYRVQFFDAALKPLATLEVGSALEARLAADSLPPGLAPHTSVVVQIDALHETDAIATSRAVSLLLP